MVSYGAVFGIIALCVAYFYTKWQISYLKKSHYTATDIVSGWEETIYLPDNGFRKVAIGINSCVDLIVPGTTLLRALDVSPADKKDHETLSSLSDLQEAFHWYLARGGAAERPFIDQEMFSKIVETATALHDAQWSVGGNAALIAQNVAKYFPNVKVQLVGPVGPRLKSLLHEDVSVPNYSISANDEVHLIMEYKMDDEWGGSLAPVATRFITSSDASNGGALMLADFLQSVTDFNADLVVFSGLHMLEGQPKDVWSKVLLDTARGLDQLTSHVDLPIHMELASMANVEFVKAIVEQLLTKVTSLGLNEQELMFASHVMGGPHGELITAGEQPLIYKVTDILAWILRTFGRSKHNPASRLTRVHFHSLTFHIIGTVTGRWQHLTSAVAAGTLKAGQLACDTQRLLEKDIELRIPLRFKLHGKDQIRIFDSSKPVTAFEHQGFEFAFSPVLVCKIPLKTVGLGDAISATGLLHSSYVPGDG